MPSSMRCSWERRSCFGVDSFTAGTDEQGTELAVFFVFTTAVHTGILGALLTVAQKPIYLVYASIPSVSNEAALADQQLAGLVMWIPAGMLLTLVGIALFAAWLGESERRSRVAGYELRPRARL